MNLIEFGTISHIKKGKKPLRQVDKPQNGYMPYVDIEAFETGNIKMYTDGEKCLPCKAGDILIVCDGSRSGFVGKAIDGYVGSTLAIISADGMSQEYLYYFLQGKYALLNTKKKGTGTPHLDANILNQQKLVVPSIDEQKRIVSRIEELFSELDNGVETLKKTKQQLAVYRQAVLKEAFDGKYTNSSPLKQASISEIADVGTGATPLTSNSDYYGGEIAWVTSAKINDEKIYIPSEYITEKAIAETNCKVYPPHTLLVAMYGEGKTRGKCAELMISAATNQALAAIELYKNTECFRNYLRWFLVLNYQLIRRKASGGVQPNLNLSIIKNISVPIFNDYDQIKIVEEIERRFSVCDSIEQTVDTALQQAEAIRQSILRKAFEGEL